MFRVNNKTQERRHLRRSGVIIVNFEHKAVSYFCKKVSS